MLSLEHLAHELTDCWRNVSRLAICGVGNHLRSDDAAGLSVLAHLQSMGMGGSRLLLVDCGQIPEDHMNRLVDAGINHVTVMDAAHLKQPPGTACLVKADEIDRAATSTHAMPLSFFAAFLEQSGITTSFVGIQPASLEVGERLTPVLEAAVKEIARIIAETLVRLGFAEQSD